MLYTCYCKSGEKTYGTITKKYYGKYASGIVEFIIVLLLLLFRWLILLVHVSAI